MKRISPDDLARVAATKGASFTGGDFNPERAISTPRSLPAPPSYDPTLRKALDDSTEASQQTVRMLAALLADVRTQRDKAPKPITKWQFDVVRDEDGQMQTIVATAVN